MPLLLRLLLLATGAPRSRCLLLPASYRCTRMYNNCMPVHHAGKPVYRQTRQALLAAFCWLPLVLLLPLRSSFWLSHTYILTCSPTDTTGEQKSQDNAAAAAAATAATSKQLAASSHQPAVSSQQQQQTAAANRKQLAPAGIQVYRCTNRLQPPRTP